MQPKAKFGAQYNLLTIDGYTLNGWWIPASCETCHAPLAFAANYDVCFCPRCNEWTKRQCWDGNCHWCHDRPERPLPPGVFYIQDIEFYIKND